MSRTFRLRTAAALATSLAVVLGVATAASAHIDPDPTEVAGGEPTMVGFLVEHGCDGSPTVKLEIQMPEGTSDFSGVDGGGFTSSVDGQVITFTGGPLDAETEQTFSVEFTAPTEGGDLSFPIIQTCEEGSIDWIEQEVEGQPEPEHPAPVVSVTPGAATTTTAAETTTTAAGSTTATSEPTASTTTAAPVVVDQGATEDDDSNSAIAIAVAVIAVLALVVMGGLLYARSRKDDAAADDAAATDAAAPAEPAASVDPADPTDPAGPAGPGA